MPAIIFLRLVLLGLIISAAPLAAASPAESFAALTDDGGWCWFSEPRAVAHDGWTCTGWVTEDGSIAAAQIDHASGRITRSLLHARFEPDDHDNPAFLVLPDGRIRVFYSPHGGRMMPNGGGPAGIRTRVTVRPGDISAWEPEEILAFPESDIARDHGISYCNPCLLAGENNTIYLFFRGRSFKPTMAKSTDGGKTWSAPQVVFSTPGLPPGVRPYAKYASNGKDRIHLLFTDGHPRNEATNSVYYACYRDGAFFKADGSRICGLDGLPIRPDQADRVYDASQTGVRAWIWGIAADAADRPVVAYARFPAQDDHRYHYARWDGKQWTDRELCAVGRWFPQTPAGKEEPEPHYSSGLALDPADPSIVYVTRPVQGVRELERWTTADGGATWQTVAITAGSRFDNVRPTVVLGHAAGGPTVLWESITGRYRGYRDYRCSIRMDSGSTAPKDPVVAAVEPDAVLATMERVADWQLKALGTPTGDHWEKDWIKATGYTGLLALDGISGSDRFRKAMQVVGDANHWSLIAKPADHADHMCMAQMYSEMFLRERRPEMIAQVRERFDRTIAGWSKRPTDDHGQLLWWWCDALFMAPPAYARLYAITGEDRYRDLFIDHWWQTSKLLFDDSEKLFFRDKRYLDKQEANGRKVFWGRGNGWVMGGLVRVLQYLPTTDPERPRFEAQLGDMAAAMLACQQPDGVWHPSLLDPASYPQAESSGSAFNTYALAWGVNQGILDRSRFEPAIRRAWAGLVACVKADGRFIHVQPVGADPRHFPPESTESYGVGAFLLAGSEIYRMAVVERTPGTRMEIRNRSNEWIHHGFAVLDAADLPKDPVVMDGPTFRILPAQTVGNGLAFPIDLAPGDRREILVLPRAALSAVPPAASADPCVPDSRLETKLRNLTGKP